MTWEILWLKLPLMSSLIMEGNAIIKFYSCAIVNDQIYAKLRPAIFN